MHSEILWIGRLYLTPWRRRESLASRYRLLLSEGQFCHRPSPVS